VIWLLATIWLAGVAALMSRRWIRARRDALPFVVCWPIALAYVIAILIYEGCYRLALVAWRWHRKARL
jgi:hypothetical protein